MQNTKDTIFPRHLGKKYAGTEYYFPIFPGISCKDPARSLEDPARILQESAIILQIFVGIVQIIANPCSFLVELFAEIWKHPSKDILSLSVVVGLAVQGVDLRVKGVDTSRVLLG